MVVRIFDALTDPVIGYVSDSISTRFGRRRPFIAFGAVGLSISVLFLFIPEVSSGTNLTLYFGFWLFALFLFWTLVTIPYESLGPELTTNYHERTTLFGLRDGFLIGGTLLAAAFPVLIDQGFDLLNQQSTEKMRLSIMAYVYAPLIILSSIICPIWKVKEVHASSKVRKK